MSSEIKWAGSGYIILNILRIANVISLFMDVNALWLMLVITVRVKKNFSFDDMSYIVFSIVCIFLVSSELSMFESYFIKYWPLLSRQSGLVFLGLVMITLGCKILSSLNTETTSVDALGLPLWRFMISSGILTALFGLFNIIATYIFCQRKLGITGRQIRSHGAAARPTSDSLSSSSSSYESAYHPAPLRHPGYHTSKELSSSCFPLPIAARYASRGASPKKSDISPPMLQDPEKAEQIIKRCSPLVPGLERPPTAMHPAYHHDRLPYPTSSRHSEVSAMTSI